ncbi:vitamin K epoxide reductase family protein [Candidatus Azambacteria bacterium]|nr:vitamin K epoxide reductase family protein [Candidatus Azambacteria bacterium]
MSLSKDAELRMKRILPTRSKTKPMPRRLKIIAILFCIVSSIGLLDAAYLTIKHYRGGVPPCTIHGCEVVLTSAQSEIAGVPVALLGALYYAAIFLLSLAYVISKKEKVLRHAAYITPAGFIASAYFVYLQLFVINAICLYCMASATTSTMLFMLGMYVIIKTRRTSIVQ